MLKMTYASMRIQITRAGNSVIPDYVKGTSRAPMWRRSFLIGFTERIHERFQEAKREATRAAKAAESDGGSSMAIVLVKKDALVENAHALAHPDVRKIRQASRTVDPAAMAEGRKAGDRADIGRSKNVGASKAPELNR